VLHKLNSVKILTIIAAVTVVSAVRITAQSQRVTPVTPLAFEVASIKPVPLPLPSGGGPWTFSRGRFRAEIGFVRGVLALAYDVSPALIKGAPDWLDREPYNIDARAEDPQAGPDQIRVMLQALLADRFKLVVHRDTQQIQTYTLVIGKNGSKLQEAKSGRSNYINWSGPGRATFTENSTLLGLTNVLSGVLESPVVDETGLKGTFNFSLDFKDPRDPRPTQPDSSPDIFTAVQDQLGLQLQATKRPTDVIVIDHMERPSPN
jgi:uncharacterized protein (TIGR03435 family)